MYCVSGPVPAEWAMMNMSFALPLIGDVGLQILDHKCNVLARRRTAALNRDADHAVLGRPFARCCRRTCWIQRTAARSCCLHLPAQK